MTAEYFESIKLLVIKHYGFGSDEIKKSKCVRRAGQVQTPSKPFVRTVAKLCFIQLYTTNIKTNMPTVPIAIPLWR